MLPSVHHRHRSHRGEAATAVLYVLGALVAVVTGYQVLKWNPFRENRVQDDARKFHQAEIAAADAQKKAEAGRQAVDQQETAVAADVKSQTQAAQSMVAATGQALAAAPPEIRRDFHVSTALQTNAVAAHALQSAVGPLSAAQLAEVGKLVAQATAASEAQRALAASELAAVQQQLAAEQADKQKHQQFLLQAQDNLRAAQHEAAATQAALEQTARQLQAAAAHRDGLGRRLEQLFLWLRLGLALYVLFAYVLPLASHFLPGLRALSELAHAVLNPFIHQEKAGTEMLARDASAATDELLELIAQRCPEALKEAHGRAGAWITEYDGVRTRFEQMLRLTHRR